MEGQLKALLVEDNPGDARLIAEMLADAKADVELKHSATLASAVDSLASDVFDIVLLDLALPDSVGIDTFIRVREAASGVAVIVLSGNTDTREAARTIEEGAQDFLVKGRVDGEQLKRSMAYAVSRNDSELRLRESEVLLLDRNTQLLQMVYDVAEAMGRIVEARDPYTQGHQERVSKVATLVAEDMGLSKDEIAAVELAALVHDIGKMCIPAEILSRPRTLTEFELALIREHPQRSYDILKGIAFPWPIAEIALQHHERMDGTGYPQGLKGDETLLAARILAVTDVVEAMSSYRPYRPALGLEAALDELRENAAHYDPVVTASCIRVCESGKTGL